MKVWLPRYHDMNRIGHCWRRQRWGSKAQYYWYRSRPIELTNSINICCWCCCCCCCRQSIRFIRYWCHSSQSLMQWVTPQLSKKKNEWQCCCHQIRCNGVTIAACGLWIVNCHWWIVMINNRDKTVEENGSTWYWSADSNCQPNDYPQSFPQL